jgi:hypothetical protein
MTSPPTIDGAADEAAEVPSVQEQKGLLDLLVNAPAVSAESLKRLVLSIDNHDVLAKVFLLEGAPKVFESSPMKYMIFREQVADRFDVGYQDICIVGSAKLGFSPSPHKFGKPFAEESDVDVVIISEEMFDRGTLHLFRYLNQLGPNLTDFGFGKGNARQVRPDLSEAVWRSMKEGVRNYVYQNFNPGLLPDTDPLKLDIFQKIRSTSPLFMALEPKVFVSKIRCRFFRNWKAAEGYYSNTLRQLARTIDEDEGEPVETTTP